MTNEELRKELVNKYQQYKESSGLNVEFEQLDSITENELLLSECSWIADTGRFSKFVENTENVKEIEPTADTIISRGAIVSAFKKKDLIRKLK